MGQARFNVFREVRDAKEAEGAETVSRPLPPLRASWDQSGVTLTSVVYPFIICASMSMSERISRRATSAAFGGASVVCSRELVLDLRLGILLLNLLGLLLISTAHPAG
jgi:hypothetical protein